MNTTALDLTHLVALAAALGWASGMRLYAVVFLTGAAGFLGWVALPPGLQLLQHPLVFWPVLAVAVITALVVIVVLFKFLRALIRKGWRHFMPRPSHV